MNITNVTVGSTKDTSKLQRARFRPGMLLESEDLELLNTYTRDLSRLLFGSLFGCGVICGLEVTADPHCDNLKITVKAGVALACSGDPVQVPKDVVFPLDESYRPEEDDKLWVVLCGTTKCCAPRTAICSSDEDETTSECSRERDGFEIKVVTERPPCVCGCPEPSNTTYKLDNMQNLQGKKIETLLASTVQTTECECATGPCYQAHYDGLCGCNCDECSDCDCKCILLARIDRSGTSTNWTVDHSVRRFIRPMLIRDPLTRPKSYSMMAQGQSLKRTVNETAYRAAGDVVLQAAQRGAQQEAKQTAQEAASILGKRAAKEFVQQFVNEAHAVEEAVRKEALEREAAAAAEVAADQQSAEQAIRLEADQQAQEISQEDKSSKQTKSTKSNKSGLPRRS